MQDFNRKIVIVVNRDLPSWQAMNTVAHISAYIGHKIHEHFDTGENFVTRDAANHPRNSQYAIVIASANLGQMSNLMAKVRASGLLYHGFIREMIETTVDEEVQQMLGQEDDADVEYLGIGIFGLIEEVDKLTKNYSLWK